MPILSQPAIFIFGLSKWLFWELFGFDNVAILQQYIDKHFPSLHQEYKDVKFQLDM